ncbi:MAG: ParM/StbA family protein [Anaerocolumna aminovalerica]|uniref:ParM/StbA family protein n=1 Tax=Anaerocolumna aminovalerica TaxID=1527 RepID=UPI00291262A7|nr:ParM/StbA family protein [Anaerocolumna aminovalerica]MDU6263740.1 ParM/StbA family protein [Anaerocolumna aminovalerica]
MVKGLDNGYAYTKDNERRCFLSAFSYTDKMISGSQKIIIDGRDYYVGVGNMTADVDKINSEVNKACTLMNLAITGAKEYYLVAGLPIGHYKLQHEKFRETILGYNKCRVEYLGEELKFTIKDVLVFPQGAAALFTMQRIDNCIIIDIGGLTIDVAYITCANGSPSIQKQNTWYNGMRKLYTDIMAQINLKYGLKLETSEAERILQKGLIIKGVEQDLRFLQLKILEFIDPVVEELKLYYPTETNPIYICGGGAIYLCGAFEKLIGNITLMKDSQFANAIGYYLVGLNKFGKYLRNVG